MSRDLGHGARKLGEQGDVGGFVEQELEAAWTVAEGRGLDRLVENRGEQGHQQRCDELLMAVFGDQEQRVGRGRQELRRREVTAGELLDLGIAVRGKDRSRRHVGRAPPLPEGGPRARYGWGTGGSGRSEVMR
jgi:hypothetical protein